MDQTQHAEYLTKSYVTYVHNRHHHTRAQRVKRGVVKLNNSNTLVYLLINNTVVLLREMCRLTQVTNPRDALGARC